MRRSALPDVCGVDAGAVRLTDAELSRIVRLVYERSGITLHSGKRALVLARLQKEVARVVQTPEVKERFGQMGLTPVGGSSEDLGRRVAADIQKWTAVAKAANIKND